MNVITKYDYYETRPRVAGWHEQIVDEKGTKMTELYPDLAIPDNTPTLRQLVERSTTNNTELPATGKPVYTGENPLLNVPFHVRKDKLEVSNFVKERIEEAKEQEEEGNRIRQEVKAKKEKARKEKAEKAQKAEEERIAAIVKKQSKKED